MFRKPSLADIYVREMSKKLDDSLIPLFTPDTSVEIGTVGRFVASRFEPNGHLRNYVQDRLNTTQSEASAWSFSSEGSVVLDTSAEVAAAPAAGMVSGRLRFTAKNGVVAAFSGVQEVRADSSEALDRILWSLYVNGQLDIDEVVVWYSRTATSGTVLVNRSKGVDVEVTADAAALGGPLSIQGLAAGVRFGGGSQASFQLSGGNLVPFIRVKGLSDDLVPRIENIRRFESKPDDLLVDLRDAPLPSVNTGRLLTGVDFDAGED